VEPLCVTWSSVFRARSARLHGERRVVPALPFPPINAVALPQSQFLMALLSGWPIAIAVRTWWCGTTS
jgi:hypothetical protein